MESFHNTYVYQLKNSPIVRFCVCTTCSKVRERWWSRERERSAMAKLVSNIEHFSARHNKFHESFSRSQQQPSYTVDALTESTMAFCTATTLHTFSHTCHSRLKEQEKKNTNAILPTPVVTKRYSTQSRASSVNTGKAFRDLFLDRSLCTQLFRRT